MATQADPPRKGQLSPDWRWRWNGKAWKPAKLTAAETVELQRLRQIHEERTASQVTREYANDQAFHGDAARMSRNGFDVASVQPISLWKNGRAYGAMMVIYRRRAPQTMTLYTKQLAPEVLWMKCTSCGRTVPEAPNCSFCGAPR
ncbi:MAG: hypothetical protein ACREQM_23140 [Candidatus Dormibacteraceae bacterium]